jgi:hypothetical protein
MQYFDSSAKSLSNLTTTLTMTWKYSRNITLNFVVLFKWVASQWLGRVIFIGSI